MTQNTSYLRNLLMNAFALMFLHLAEFILQIMRLVAVFFVYPVTLDRLFFEDAVLAENTFVKMTLLPCDLVAWAVL